MKAGDWMSALPLLSVSLAANAYIDPNSGGLLFQVLTPILIVLAAGWHWIRDGVLRMFSKIRSWPSSRPHK